MKIHRLIKILSIICFVMAAVLPAQTQIPQNPLNVQERQLKRMASEFERNGELERAVDIFSVLCMQNPADITSYAGAKRCLVQLQDYDRLQSLVLELQKSRRDIRYPVDLAEIEYLRGNTKDAKNQWHQILQDNAMSQTAYALVGQVLQRHGMIDEAIDCYQTSRKKLNNDHLFIFELATLYTVKEEYKKVTREYVRFLARNPKQQHYIDSRFKALEAEPSSVPDIIKELKAAINETPDIQLELQQVLANVYSRNQQYDNALEQFIVIEDRLAAQKEPRSGLYLYQFGVLCSNEGELDMAGQAFKYLVDNYPSSRYGLQARLGISSIHEYRGDYYQAIESYNRFVGQYPRSIEAHDALIRIGDIYSGPLSSPDSAIITYRRLLNRYPKSPRKTETLFKLGDCEIRNDHVSDARAGYNIILLEHQRKKDIEYKKALYAMARSWFLDGNLAQTREFLQQYFSNDLKGNKTDIYENDALELNMLLTENMMDSTGLVTLARAKRLFIQEKFAQGDTLLLVYLTANPQTLLAEQINLLRAEIYVQQQQYQPAVALLDTLYKNEQNLYRDKALWTLAGLYAGPLQQSPQAVALYESLLVNFPESIYIEETRKQIRNLQ